jgi:hypothetical protein
MNRELHDSALQGSTRCSHKASRIGQHSVKLSGVRGTPVVGRSLHVATSDRAAASWPLSAAEKPVYIRH